MSDHERLENELRRIDGRGYRAYQDLSGSWRFPHFTLHVDHVQGDPFASPSHLCVEISRERAGLGPELGPSRWARIAVEDFLGRCFDRAIREVVGARRGRSGMGKSGLIEVDAGGQEVLERSSVVLTGSALEVRFVLGLPARGRTVLGREAAHLLLDEVPAIIARSILAGAWNPEDLDRHVRTVEDWKTLRDQLEEARLVAFIGDGSILPRRSGVDPRPLSDKDAVKFEAPASLRVELSGADGRKISGMGVPEGVTLIVGGGFHGKSTLLDAIALGVYPHVPGDGRELVATTATAMKARAEDGRRVEAVDISGFIDNLPAGKDTRRFCTDNASGSTSQAAAIMEALELGARALLLDEDTSATNFMIRDRRMQELVAREREPITPFIDRVREIYDNFGCSTVLVAGGSGDYFEAADTVIRLDAYRPEDATEEAWAIAARLPTRRAREARGFLDQVQPRRPGRDSFDPSRGKREVKIGARGMREINFGTTTVDVSALDQLVDLSQVRAVGELIHFFSSRYLKDGGLREGLEAMMAEIEARGLDVISPRRIGNLALPRALEVAAAINRMRSLRIE